MYRLFLFFALTAFCLPLFAQSAIDVYDFDSEADQARYEQLIEQLRCPKCLNTNLAGSDAPIAADLRAEIYEQIQSGRSNDEIVEFMTARYGDFINYRPPLNPGTFLLWFGPLILLAAGFLVLFRLLRNNQRTTEAESGLSSEQRQKLSKLLSSQSDK